RRQRAVAISRSQTLTHQLEVNEFFTRLTEEARRAGGRLAEWWGERRCLAALDGQAAPDGYGKLLLPDRPPAHFLLELDRATEDDERLLVFAVPTRARRDGVAAALASSSVPHRVIVWTPQHSPLAALRDAL